MNLVNVGVVLDPTQTQQGAAAIKKEFDGVASASDKMSAQVGKAAASAGQSLGKTGSTGESAGKAISNGGANAAKGLSAVDAAAKRAQAALEGAANAGGFLQRSLEFALGGALERVAEKGLDAIFEIPAQAIERGLDYNDVVAKATNSIAGMIQASRPDQVKNFADALRQAGEVVTSLQQKVQQYHFSSLDDLNAMFTSVATGTAQWGISLKQQIDIASQLLAAFRAKNVDGQQASRDAIDVLVGRGQRVVAANEIFGSVPGGSIEKFTETVKAIQAGTAPATDAIKQLQEATSSYADASEHSLSILSVTWHAFLQNLDQGLGGPTKGLYDELVSQINRVRAVINDADFGGVMKPLTDGLTQAAKLAGDLAVGLAVDPQKTGELLLATLKWAFSAGVDFLVSEIPTIGNALIETVKGLGPVLLDIMFAAAAVLNASIRGAVVAAKGALGIHGEEISLGLEAVDVAHAKASADGSKVSAGLMTQQDYDQNKGSYQADYQRQNNDLIKNSQQYMRDRRAVDNGGTYTPADQSAMQQSYLDSTRQASGDMEAKLETMISGLKSGNINQQTTAQLLTTMQSIRDSIKDEATRATNKAGNDAMTKSLSPPTQADHDLSINGKVVSEPSDKVLRQNALDDQDLAIAKDKIAVLIAQASASSELIAKANEALQVDEYHKSLLSDQKLSLQDAVALTAQYAANASKVVRIKQDELALQKQVNAAEVQATAAKGRVQAIQQDPFTSQLAKRPQLNQAYDTEIAALQRSMTLLQQEIDSGKLKNNPGALAQRQKEIGSDQKEIVNAQTQKSLQSDSGQFQQGITKYMDSLGTAGTNTANIITGTLNTAIQATSDNIQKVIDGSETWGQAFQNIGLQILQMLEQLILKMILATAVQAALTAMGGGGGAAGGFAGLLVGANHTGGIVGEESSFVRTLPRFHNGGVSDDEQLAVLKKGEAVLTPGQMRAINGGQPSDSAGGQQVQVHITNITDPSEGARHIMENPDSILNPLAKRRKQLRALVS